MTALDTRIDEVRQRISNAGVDPDKVKLIAVTKGFGIDTVRAALAAGLTDLAENYAQDLAAKASEIAPKGGAYSPSSEQFRVDWHFVGRLQRNKVRKIAPYVSLWQSVDRLALGQEIARRAPGAAVLVQVDISGEPTKGGCPPDDVPELLRGLADQGLEVRGLMAIGPRGTPEQARPGFRMLRELAQQHGLEELSMGMSADLEVGVAEGATMVRVGTALFGPRPSRVEARH